MSIVFTSFKHPKLPISIKIPVTLLQIVYICMTALCPNSTLPHNLIKEINLLILFKKTFQREGSPYLAYNDRNGFFTSENPKSIMHGRVKMYVMH